MTRDATRETAQWWLAELLAAVDARGARSVREVVEEHAARVSPSVLIAAGRVAGLRFPGAEFPSGALVARRLAENLTEREAASRCALASFRTRSSPSRT